MYIVTGKTGNPHVTGADDAAFNAGVTGNGDYILSNTDFSITRSGNTFRLGRAELLMQGVHSRIEGNEELTVDDGDQGMYRIDSIVAFYQLDVSSGIETTGVKIIAGTPKTSLSDAKAPDIDNGDLYNHASYREARIANIQLYESTVQNYEVVIDKLPCLVDINACNERMDEIKGEVVIGSTNLGGNTWRYIRRKNGPVEYYGYVTVKANVTNSSGNLYYGTVDIQIPTMPSEVDCITTSLFCHRDYCWLGNNNGWNSGTLHQKIWSNESFNDNIGLSVHMIGH